MKRFVFTLICLMILSIPHLKAQLQSDKLIDDLLNTVQSVRYFDSTELDSVIIEVMETYH